jgi:hypothetical protein
MDEATVREAVRSAIAASLAAGTGQDELLVTLRREMQGLMAKHLTSSDESAILRIVQECIAEAEAQRTAK